MLQINIVLQHGVIFKNILDDLTPAPDTLLKIIKY